MAIFFAANDCLAVWRSAALHLCQTPRASEANLVLEVKQPFRRDNSWFRQVDPRTVSLKGENPSNVANTIFPSKTWINSDDREDFYRRYLLAHRRGHVKRWGTYFLRLISFGRSNVNQLERAIEVLKEWKNSPGTALVFHLSSPELDRPRPLGGPCLQLIQLQVCDGTVGMTAVYRNHDYFNKAFPNLIGLARLLNYICSESSHKAGTLICHSGHAYSSASKKSLKALIDRT